MTDKLNTVSPTTHAPPATPVRIGIGALRVATAAVLLAAVITQITDQTINGAFRAEEYFAYFTIQTALANVVVLGYAGVIVATGKPETGLLSLIRANITAYAIVTAVVYNVLLRGLPQSGFQGIAWPNEVLHVWVPALIVLDFLFAPGRQRIPWSRVGWSVVYPLLWVAFTLTRAALDGWYPYPFLNPAEPAGVVGVVAYVVGIASFILILGVLAIVVSRVGNAPGGTHPDGRISGDAPAMDKESTAGPWG